MNLRPFFSENDLQKFRSNFDTLSKDSAGKYSSLAVLLFSIVMFYISGTFSANPIDIINPDWRVFFIPFVGAAATGKHDSESQVKKAVVSLMDPIPGILLSIVLFEFVEEKNAHVIQAVNVLRWRKTWA